MFPVLCRFLDVWQRELDGKLRSVKVACVGLITPGEARLISHQFQLQ